jgi:2-dehydro-3-deoxyphosphooctonate aldolase (KDO 8-P synthase)
VVSFAASPTLSDASLEVSISGPRGELVISNQRPITFMIGMNVLETEERVEACLNQLQKTFSPLDAQVIFKASFDKANRSSHFSARGPGLDEGLHRLKTIRETYGYPILTDIHTEAQAAIVSEVADIIQVPAFLCRQTDLIQAACEAQKPLHIKKMQMMAPHELGAILEKCHHFGHNQVILCERGTQFGYGRLIVDPLSFIQLKHFGVPVSFDVTHSLQLPGVGGLSQTTHEGHRPIKAGGRSEYTLPLAYAAVSQSISSIFIECHPQPSEAWCDGACALPLSSLDSVVTSIIELDTFVKTHSPY